MVITLVEEYNVDPMTIDKVNLYVAIPIMCIYVYISHVLSSHRFNCTYTESK